MTKNTKYAIATIFDSILIVAGCVLVYLCLVPNSGTMDTLESLSLAYHSGEKADNLGTYIMGMISNGYVVSMPEWQYRTGLVLGSFMAYFGFVSLSLHRRKKSIKILFTKRYWTSFQPEIDDVK